ncbi:hypothetical protein LH51_07495 [Nitrincola sp. A-D6]|uniref:YqgE/AlgH family protein n=1 Tax=Nitrincola sp. A-D6 TaxID=1545442 RepID=UPI00051FEADF|nr:YqgE/AlgH family protein [Nitrincola sp. A-D6]KGK42364.1 hypothetical protein LH51_07495 [Nitrincola sp. A-D6]
MTDSTSLRDQFLISMPHLDDRHFSRTLTYVCDHSEYGAMGIIINRPAGILVHDLLNHIQLDHTSVTIDPMPVFKGGPIHPDRGFVLHRDDGRRWLSSHPITSEIQLTTSMDILEAMALGEGPKDCLVALGYAGWSPGQLEHEIYENTWLSCQANSDIMFRLPAEERLQAAAASLGVNLQLLTTHAGHA